MSWLRIDDGFASHPKIVALSDRDLRHWLHVLCYCARYETDGEITPAQLREVGVPPSALARFRAVDLVDIAGDSVRVHGWDGFNPPKDPTAAERKRRQRDRDMHRDNDRDTERDIDRDETVTRARAGARGPSRPVLDSPRASSVGPARDDDDDELISRLDELKPSERQRLGWLLAASIDRGKVERQLAAAVANGRNPAAYLDALIERGEDPAALPDAPPVERPPIDPDREAAARDELEALGPYRSAEEELRAQVWAARAEREETADDDD